MSDGVELVRCADCLFLALRRGDGVLVEADTKFRAQATHATLARAISASGTYQRADTYSEPPLCMKASIRDFRKEMRRLFDQKADGFPSSMSMGPETILAAIQHPRACREWEEHTPGLTPSEVRQIMQARILDEREDRRDREMRDREDQRDREMRQREDRRDEDAEKRHKRELLAFGVLIAAATLFGSIIQAGWIGRPF